MTAPAVLAQQDPGPADDSVLHEAERLVAESGGQALSAIEARLEQAMGQFDLTEACHLWSVWLAAKRLLDLRAD